MKSRSLVLSSAFKGPLSNTAGQDANVFFTFDCTNALISSHEQIIEGEYGSCDKNKYRWECSGNTAGKKKKETLIRTNFPLSFFFRKHTRVPGLPNFIVLLISVVTYCWLLLFLYNYNDNRLTHIQTHKWMHLKMHYAFTFLALM